MINKAVERLVIAFLILLGVPTAIMLIWATWAMFIEMLTK